MHDIAEPTKAIPASACHIGTSTSVYGTESMPAPMMDIMKPMYT